ncbi:MAG: carboxypeptidase-like regulatory domain-containing protein [Mangrovibacterium sp.]
MIRLTVFCFFLSLIQMMAMESYSQQTRLSLNLNNQRLENVLKTIEDKSEFFFLYNRDMINVDQIVTVNATNQTITEILDELLKGSGIKYSIVNRQIILSNVKGGLALTTQQMHSVSGRVTDSSGAPLPGVTVVVKGTTNGTITGADGSYNLTNIPADATLLFSFIGMKMQEVPVAGKTVLAITMEEETVGIDEVVVVGYGVQKKLHLTGSVSQVTAKELVKTPASNVSQLLVGKMPGIVSSQSNGAPGTDGVTLLVRGYSTWTSSGPLILVDGVERGMNNLDPNDIESVVTLKDGGSGSLWDQGGCRGDHGNHKKRFPGNPEAYHYL